MGQYRDFLTGVLFGIIIATASVSQLFFESSEQQQQQPPPAVIETESPFHANVTSAVIEIGLHSAVHIPIGCCQGVIGIDASLESLRTYWENFQHKNVLIMQAAMFSEDKVSLFHMVPNWPAANSLIKQDKYHEFNPLLLFTASNVVPTLRLLHVLNIIPKNIHIDMVKVDAQGVDLLILKSGEKGLLRADSVYSECARISPNGRDGGEYMRTKQNYCHMVREYLESLGFVHMAELEESPTDISADVLAVKPIYVDPTKKCVQVFQGISQKGGVEECVMKEILVAREKIELLKSNPR
jgi:hypothetical protein